MLNEVIQETKERMTKSLKAFEKEMTKVRTGRASTTLLDGVKVDYYGAETPLDQMASVSVPESRLLTVKPWDVSVINDVEKAILKADANIPKKLQETDSIELTLAIKKTENGLIISTLEQTDGKRK